MSEQNLVTSARCGDEVAHGPQLAVAQSSGGVMVPYRTITTVESIACGFRQEMLSLDGDSGRVGGVSTGAGWGTDFLLLDWKDGKALVRGLDLLRAWVAVVDPEGVVRLPAGLAAP